MSLGEIFTLIETNRAALHISEVHRSCESFLRITALCCQYALSEATLEQIFLSVIQIRACTLVSRGCLQFAKQQEEEAHWSSVITRAFSANSNASAGAAATADKAPAAIATDNAAASIHHAAVAANGADFKTSHDPATAPSRPDADALNSANNASVEVTFHHDDAE